MKIKKEPSITFAFSTITILALSILIITALTYNYIFGFSLPRTPQELSQFSDYFNGITSPTISFLALIALLITIKIQSDTLKLSQKELEMTRIELQETKLAAQSQANHFENEEKINDIEASIQLVTSDLLRAKHWKVIYYNPQIHTRDYLPLEYFLEKDIETDILREIGAYQREDKFYDKYHVKDREIRNMLLFLHNQICLLKDTKGAEQRYQFHINKYYLSFFFLYRTGIIDWDWTSMLNEEQKKRRAKEEGDFESAIHRH